MQFLEYCDIILSPNKLNKCTIISVCFYFGKNACSFLHTCNGAKSLFGDNLSYAFFGVWLGCWPHTFLIYGKIMGVKFSSLKCVNNIIGGIYMIKKTLMGKISLFLIILLLIGNTNFISAKSANTDWSDVQNYYPFSSWAVDTGIKYKLIFLENNTRETKRLEIANILYNILALSKTNNKIKEFNDVENVGNKLKDRIMIVANMGIISGYEDGSFRPDNNVTRAEFAAMLDRSNILKDVTDTNSNLVFIDTSNHWAEKSINKIAKFNIVSGKGEGKFCPEDNITPQEIFIILDRLVDLKCLESEDLILAMTDTFKCKKYGEKEQYIIEVMYSKFDQVQNDIKYMWPYSKYYDVTNWQGLATYEDLLYAMYFTIPREADVYRKLDNGELKIERMAKYMLEVQGLEADKNKYFSQGITMRNLLFAICTANSVEHNNLQNWDNKIMDFGSDTIIEMAEFSNMDELSRQEQGAVASASITYKYNKKFYESNTMYFPIDAPITRYMLNYTILCLQEKYNTYQHEMGNYIAKFLGQDIVELETDISKMPYNYYEYPFIIKGIPKEVYETPYNHSNIYDVHKPIECHPDYFKYTFNLIGNSYHYYDTILNVDYRTINKEDFISKVMRYGITSRESAAEYVQYVIDNKIILRGKGCAIPGTIMLPQDLLHVRVMVEFEVVSADVRKDLVFGDFSNGTGYDINHVPVEYNKSNYNVHFDVQVSGALDFKNKKIAEYRITATPMIRDIYFYDSTIHTMP